MPLLIDKKASDLPDLGITAESKVYISESLTRYKKELFGEVNKLREKIRWKHIWTQNSRIYVKESDKSTVVVIDAYKVLDKFKSSLPPRSNQSLIGIAPIR